jgi:hypothetical protein
VPAGGMVAWTEEETEALRAAVAVYGPSSWAEILADPAYKQQLKRRTNVRHVVCPLCAWPLWGSVSDCELVWCR